LSVTYYFSSRDSAIEQARLSAVHQTEDSAHAIDLLLAEKGQVAATITTAPVLTDALIQSNSDYGGLGDGEIQKHIDDLNVRWIAAEGTSDPVVQNVLSNPVADYLRAQQAAFPGEYGEIFVTNRYGALVASTGKLTTLAHAHKYWWQASYQEGEGKTFFDDRGYDASVEGYVLGVVVPVRQGTEIIGILKCNLNITGALTDAIKLRDREQIDTIKLVRSGGLVVLEEGKEPLSTSVSSRLVDEMNRRWSGSLTVRGDGGDELLAYAPIPITHGSDEYAFGGSQMSIDHTQGNQGEGWHIVGSRPLEQVIDATWRTARLLVIIGVSFGLIMGLGALLLSRALARPLMALVEQSRRIGQGDFDAEVDIRSKDELGDLAGSFNTMARDLRETMISRDLLIAEATQREQAEEALRESEEKARVLLNATTEVAMLLTPDGFLVAANESAAKRFGLTPEGLAGKCPFDFSQPEVAERRWKIFRELVAGKKPARFEDENRGTHYDNSMFPVLDGDGAVRLVALFAQDITERKQAEKDREMLQGQLNQAQKMESVGRLAGGVAHDFNNMLGVILGHTEMAMEEVDPSGPLSAGLQEIQKAAHRSADLTRQLLAFARKQTIVPQVLDLNETVEGMLKMLRRLIGEDIHLAWLPGSEVWPVKLDPSQIDQVMANLCVNARDAIEGVGKVTIETENTTFDQAYCDNHPGSVPGAYVLLAVSDDGCGMDSETLDMLFEPFFTTKEVGTGTGLGLATVYGIVKQNDGFINVYSEPGDGTTRARPNRCRRRNRNGRSSGVMRPSCWWRTSRPS